MSSQLGNENTAWAKRTGCHDSCSDLVVDIFRRLLSRVWSARMAVAQASCALFEVRALRDPGVLTVGRIRLVRLSLALHRGDRS
jgi:hypothetical protein